MLGARLDKVMDKLISSNQYVFLTRTFMVVGDNKLVGSATRAKKGCLVLKVYF